MPWVKGQSGNPKGRKKGVKTLTAALRKIMDEKDEVTGETNRKLVIKALIEAAQAGNVPAMNLIYERLDGKLVAQAELTGEGGGPIKYEISVTDDETAELTRRLLGQAHADEGISGQP